MEGASSSCCLHLTVALPILEHSSMVVEGEKSQPSALFLELFPKNVLPERGDQERENSFLSGTSGSLCLLLKKKAKENFPALAPWYYHTLTSPVEKD